MATTKVKIISKLREQLNSSLKRELILKKSITQHITVLEEYRKDIRILNEKLTQLRTEINKLI